MDCYEVSRTLCDNGEVLSSQSKFYSTMEEAKKAEAYLKSLPRNPEDEFYQVYIRVSRQYIHKKFVPWYTEEQLERWQKEAEEYQKELEAMVDFDPYDDPAM